LIRNKEILNYLSSFIGSVIAIVGLGIAAKILFFLEKIEAESPVPFFFQERGTYKK